MEKLLLRSVIPVFLVLSSCGPVEPDKDAVSDYDVVSGNVNQMDSGGFEGTGIIRFKTAADTVATLDLDANLRHTGSSVSVLSHALLANLSDGVRLTFTRSSADTVTGSIQIGNGTISSIRGERLSRVRTDSLDMTIEIRNDWQWPRTQILAWPRETPRESGDAAIFDTEMAGHLNAPLTSVGPGSNIGIQMRDASVSKARLQ